MQVSLLSERSNGPYPRHYSRALAFCKILYPPASGADCSDPGLARLPPTDFFDQKYPPQTAPLPPQPEGTLRTKYPRTRGVKGPLEGRAEMG